MFTFFKTSEYVFFQVDSAATPCCDFYFRSRPSQPLVFTQDLHSSNKSTPSTLSPVDSSDQLQGMEKTDERWRKLALESSIAAELSLIVLWKVRLTAHNAIRWILINSPGSLHSNSTGLFRQSKGTWSRSFPLCSQLAKVEKYTPDMSLPLNLLDTSSWSISFQLYSKIKNFCEYVKFGAISRKIDIMSITD